VISTTISGFLLGMVTLVLGIMLHRSKKHVHVLLKSTDPWLPFHIVSINFKVLENIIIYLNMN
jgi:hypothetical protein